MVLVDVESQHQKYSMSISTSLNINIYTHLLSPPKTFNLVKDLIKPTLNLIRLLYHRFNHHYLSMQNFFRNFLLLEHYFYVYYVIEVKYSAWTIRNLCRECRIINLYDRIKDQVDEALRVPFIFYFSNQIFCTKSKGPNKKFSFFI